MSRKKSKDALYKEVQSMLNRYRNQMREQERVEEELFLSNLAYHVWRERRGFNKR